ncbi:hypothetical protein OIU84_014867 [Salix udensis]|uniref:Protein kinase domain-containing protein n=1 Tax=Salix udensis TaxID=889485 RepID=A0AAD6JDE7_9ROSI|nr:hypothetical protein OIU84_014867 [Salix udensis]
MAISGLDLSSIKDELAVAYFKDFVVDASLMSDGLAVEVGPMGDETGTRNAILNGLEVFKMSSRVNSLDGVFGVDGKMLESHKAVVYVGFGLMFGAFVGLGAMLLKWHKRPQDWQKRDSFSSWLLPVHAELQEATKNFDSSEIIGVGGFGNVYLGMIDDGTKVAVKRGKAEDESKLSAALADSPAAVAAPDAFSTSVTEDSKSPAEVQATDDHSGTAMFSQFSGLNGR